MRPLQVWSRPVSEVFLWRGSNDTTHLQTDCRNLVLRNAAVVINDIRQRPALHKLHDHPQLECILLKKRIQEVDNVVMPALLHHNNLIHNQLLPRLTTQIHLLDRHLCPRTVLPNQIPGRGGWRTFTYSRHVHRAGRALPNLLLLVIALKRVGQVDYGAQPFHDLRIRHGAHPHILFLLFARIGFLRECGFGLLDGIFGAGARWFGGYVERLDLLVA